MSVGAPCDAPKEGNGMNSEAFAGWLESLCVSERIRALTLVYSAMTVYTRELFFPDTRKGRESVILDMLHGVNEIHHTLANFLLRWADNEEDWPPQVLSQQLLEIANQYRIVGRLNSAIEFAQTRNWTPKA
jgi:hypothetical protein